MDMILLFYHQMIYEYFLLIFQDYEEYEIVNVQRMYLFYVDFFYLILFFKKKKRIKLNKKKNKQTILFSIMTKIFNFFNLFHFIIIFFLFSTFRIIINIYFKLKFILFFNKKQNIFENLF